jgi:hypothetical protein
VSFQSTVDICDAPVSCEALAACEGAAVDMPDAIVDCLEADICPNAGVCDVDPWMVPTDTSVRTHVAPLAAVGVRQRWQLVGPLPWGRCIAGGGGVRVECLVRTLMIARFTEVVELSRLGAKSCPRRSGGVGFQRAMQALMTAILWRCARFNELRQEAQAHPPRRPWGQPGAGVGGARHPVVGAEAVRPAACVEHPREDRRGLLHAGGGAGCAPEPEAAVASSDGQRIVVAAVPGLDMPVDVGAPHRVGCRHVAGGVARMPSMRGPSPVLPRR